MDGKGQTLVYYFSLPEGWEPGQVQNPAALALAQRFINDGRESDRWAAGQASSCQGLLVGFCLPGSGHGHHRAAVPEAADCHRAAVPDPEKLPEG